MEDDNQANEQEEPNGTYREKWGLTVRGAALSTAQWSKRYWQRKVWTDGEGAGFVNGSVKQIEQKGQ